jgi:hypothetical protein
MTPTVPVSVTRRTAESIPGPSEVAWGKNCS